jgi:hypothetical protein
MKKSLVFSIVALASLIAVANTPILQVSAMQPFSALYFETFNGLNAFDDFRGPLSDHWAVYRGNPQITSANGRDAVLRMDHPQPDQTLAAFKAPAATSIYLTNPATTTFADGLIEFDIYFETAKDSGVSAMLTFRMQGDDTYYALQLTSTKDWKCHFMKNYGWQTWQIIGTESDQGIFPSGLWSHVTVTIAGQRFQCYKDGVLICEAQDGTWQSGTWGGIGFQNNYYNGVFYISNFRIPQGFEWTTYRGYPVVDYAAGRSAPSLFFDHPSQVGDEAPFADVNTYSAYISKPNTKIFRNGIIEFDMEFDNPGGNKAYVTFRMQSDSQYYALRLTSTKDWSCYFIQQNGWSPAKILGIQSAQGMIAPQTWTHIKIVIDGGLFQCYRDGYLLCTAFDQTWSYGIWGGIGFYNAYNLGVFHIDNVMIHMWQ